MSGVTVAKILIVDSFSHEDGTRSRSLTRKQINWLLSDSGVRLESPFPGAKRRTYSIDSFEEGQYVGRYEGVVWPNGAGSIIYIPAVVACDIIDESWEMLHVSVIESEVVEASAFISDHLLTCLNEHFITHKKFPKRVIV